MTALPLVRPLTKVFGCNTPVVLALDFGEHMGWACRHADGRVAHGIAEFDNRGGVGYRWLRLRCWLNDFKEGCGADVAAVYYEECHFTVIRSKSGKPGKFVSDGHATRVYGGFEATATCWCEHQRIPYRGIPVGTIKKFIYHGRAKKEEIVAAVCALGYDVEDHNEADALALLLLAIERIDGASE